MSDRHGNTGLLGRAWFKPLVGAWFALLLGGGMWLMPPHVHALIARSTGLAQLHPIFAPPVSGAGVAVLCIVVALFGLLFGIAVAGRIAAAAAPRAFAPGFEFLEDSAWQEEAEMPADGIEEPRRRRVFSAREDIGEEGIAISAPTGEASYETEYSIDDIPPAGPVEEFEAVYADMEGGANVAEEGAVQDTWSEEDETAEYTAFGTEDGEIPEDAEFEHVPEFDPGREPVPADYAEDSAEPDTLDESPEALGDMSLGGLLDRLEGALEQHKKMVTESEEAAQQPAPQPVQMTREIPAEDTGADDRDLPEVSEDDPVIAFLRREASRRMPEAPDGPDSPDEEDSTAGGVAPTEAQAALRSALERLGQVNRRD